MPASIGVNMRVTGHYSQGGRLHMEDKFSVAYQQTEDERDLEYAYFGIFDGHGGTEAAAYAKDHLMEAIVRQKHFWSDDDADVLRAIRNGYMMTHMNMWKELEKWPKVIHGLPSTAGTTASVAFIRRGKIYIGHVGDSAIVLGYQVDGKEEWCAKPLTMDHKPESAAEMQRIQSSGGKVVPKSGVHRVVWNRFVMGKGKLRHEEIPFLAIARSLGDHWSYNTNTDEFVVSPDPDVGVLSIDPAKFKCLIFGTDGLWNMISPKMAVHLVQQAQKHNDHCAFGVHSTDPWLNPSKILVDNAIDRWANTKVRADNTSVVTVMMDPPGPPRRAPISPPLLRPSNPTYGAQQENEPSKPCKSDSPVPVASDRTVEKTSTEAATNVNSAPRLPARTNTHNSGPLPSMSNMPQYSQASHLNSPIHNPLLLEEEEEDHVITNYGNPSESYFIARLLNKTQIRNSLQHVYDEIMKPQVEVPQQQSEEFPNNNNNVNNVDKSTVKKTPLLQKTGEDSPVPEIPPDNFEDVEIDKKEENEEVIVEDEECENPDDSSKTEEQESIQINEVSSSSPVDVTPKPRKRKSKGVAKTSCPIPQFTPRILRSNDAPPIPLRPQTRLITDKSRTNPTTPKTPTIQRKNPDSRVPVPVHSAKSILQPGKISILQSKPKFSPAILFSKHIPSTKTEPKKVTEKNPAKSQKSVAVVDTKQAEKVDVKTKTLPTKVNETPVLAVNHSRVTRSKDVQSPSTDVIPKETGTSKKFQLGQDLDKLPTSEVPPERSKNSLRSCVGTRQKTNTNDAVPFCAPKGTGSTSKGRNREQTLGSNPECCKENMLTQVSASPRPVPLNSTKRRNSGGGTCEMEPREKRRTRLGDKNNPKLDKTVEEQHQDVTSTESIKESDFMLGVSVCHDHSFASEDTDRSCGNVLTDSELSSKMKFKNKKVIKFVKGNSSVNEISGEVHSTTFHIETFTPTSKVRGNALTMRILRPRHDAVLSDKKANLKSDKRILRSNNCMSELVNSSSKLPSEKESRPILRSKNSVGALPSKSTPRRRVPWPQTLRHNLRKRFSK